MLFWNVRGHKTFHGCEEPDRWAPLPWAVEGANHAPRPEELPAEGGEGVLSYECGDDTVLWNHLLTPVRTTTTTTTTTAAV